LKRVEYPLRHANIVNYVLTPVCQLFSKKCVIDSCLAETLNFRQNSTNSRLGIFKSYLITDTCAVTAGFG
jgi:hypothetical protein